MPWNSKTGCWPSFPQGSKEALKEKDLFGNLLWGVESILALVAAYAVGVRIAGHRGALERLLVVGVVSSTSVLFLCYAAALLNVFTLPVLAISALALHGGMLFWAARGDVWTTLRRDLRVLPRVARDLWLQRELPLLWPILLSALLVAVSVVQVVFYPTWSWDCVWYHKPMTQYVVQNGSLAWLDTNIPHLNSFSRHIEMFSAWNVLLMGSTGLDDLPQIPLGILGALAVAALCRRTHAPESVCLGLGCVWLCLPSVALQLHTTHADVGGAAYFLVGFYFLTQPSLDRLSRWMAVTALGLYAGSKGTGLFHLVLLAPYIAFRFFRAVQFKEALLLGTSLAFPGLVVYVRNILQTGNPYWPLKVTLPVLGLQLPGTLTPEAMGSHPPAFFGFTLAGIQRMTSIWTVSQGEFFPDLREFPFGWVFPYALLPALTLLLFSLPFRRRTLRNRVSVLALAVVAVLVPAAWWGRFVLALPAAGLVAYAGVYQMVQFRPVRVLLTAWLAWLLIASHPHTVEAYRMMPALGFSAEVSRANDAHLRATLPWLWPKALADRREGGLRKGDVIVHDESASFTGEFWTEDAQNAVHYLPQQGIDSKEYLRRVAELRATWVAVGANSPAERILRHTAVEFLGQLPHTSAQLFRIR